MRGRSDILMCRPPAIVFQLGGTYHRCSTHWAPPSPRVATTANPSREALCVSRPFMKVGREMRGHCRYALQVPRNRQDGKHRKQSHLSCSGRQFLHNILLILPRQCHIPTHAPIPSLAPLSQPPKKDHPLTSYGSPSQPSHPPRSKT